MDRTSLLCTYSWATVASIPDIWPDVLSIDTLIQTATATRWWTLLAFFHILIQHLSSGWPQRGRGSMYKGHCSHHSRVVRALWQITCFLSSLWLVDIQWNYPQIEHCSMCYIWSKDSEIKHAYTICLLTSSSLHDWSESSTLHSGDLFLLYIYYATGSLLKPLQAGWSLL